jgi:hypothetical protein
LVAALLDGPERRLEEVARTRVSVHYDTGDALVPVLTVSTPDAVRLPPAVLTSTIPALGGLWVGGGTVWQRSTVWRVTRWWRPARPTALHPPARDLRSLLPRNHEVSGVPVPPWAYDGLQPADLVGRGPGLTPAGDDLLAGALVAARATGDSRFASWRASTRQGLANNITTAVSRALLHHACDGYATPELAAFLEAACGGGDPGAAAARLSAVGHSSGPALLLGALHALTTHRLEGAA